MLCYLIWSPFCFGFGALHTRTRTHARGYGRGRVQGGGGWGGRGADRDVGGREVHGRAVHTLVHVVIDRHCWVRLVDCVEAQVRVKRPALRQRLVHKREEVVDDESSIVARHFGGELVHPPRV